MNGPGPKQEGAALDRLLLYHETTCSGAREEPCDCGIGAARLDLAALRSRLSEQADLIDRLTRENAEMKAEHERVDAIIYRSAKSILANVHGEKPTLEVNSQSEGVVKTSQM